MFSSFFSSYGFENPGENSFLVTEHGLLKRAMSNSNLSVLFPLLLFESVDDCREATGLLEKAKIGLVHFSHSI